MYKPLLESEVPQGMKVHLDHQRMNGHRSEILVECPACHQSRWCAIVNIRNGHYKTPYCRACYLQRGNTAFLKPGELTGDDIIIYLDRQELVHEKRGRKQQMLRILSECPDCHKQRWIRVNSFRNGKTKTTICNVCSRKRQYHPLPKKGIQITNGYRELHLRNLSPEDRALAEQYFAPRIFQRPYIYEHRLVALKTYGPIAVAPGMVVRHINGDKLDNRPENLMPGTQSDNRRDHVEAIAEMEAWRALALFLLQRVHNP